MPTYDYQCDRCGHRFERFGRMSDPPAKACPECGGEARRLIGAGAAVIVKGSGPRAAGQCAARPGCGRERPCCGRDTPCDVKPCDE